MQPLAQGRTQGAETRTIRVRRPEAIVVSGDDGLLIELGSILGDRYRTRSLDHADQITPNADASRCLVLVDTTQMADAQATIARLQHMHPGAQIIVVAAKADDWNAAVHRGTVVAALARDQLDSARLHEALNTADARMLQLTDAAAGSGLARTPGSGRARALVLLSAVALLAAAGSGWWLLRARHAPPPTAPDAMASDSASTLTPSASASTATQPMQVPELLSAARIAFRDPKMLLPRADTDARGDSALELYAKVLTLQPTNDEAQDGVSRLLGIAKGRIQTDLAGGKLDDAARLIELFKAAGVGADATRDLDASLAAARPKWLSSRAQENIAAGDFTAAQQLIDQLSAAGAERGSIDALQSAMESKRLEQQLLPLANQLKTAIDTGALLDPASESARTRLQAMRALNRNHPLTLAAQRDLQSALLSRAQDATHKDQFDQAQHYLAAAADIGSSADITEAKRALQTEMDSASQRAAQQAATDAKASESAVNTSATAANALVDQSAPHYLAARVKALHVNYPSVASNNNVEGYATVEFTLHTDGSASNAAVVDAKPARIFDQAALEAITHGRFDGSMLGAASSARARFRILFKLSK